VAARKARHRLRVVAPRARIGAGTVAGIAGDVVLPALGSPEPFPREHTRPSSLHEMLRSQTMSMSLPALLRVEDRNSMFHSIEARVPFLDHRLVELLFRLPPDLKIRDTRNEVCPA
jgi:asparagine synthase (glutamine-hydrolysing)